MVNHGAVAVELLGGYQLPVALRHPADHHVLAAAAAAHLLVGPFGVELVVFLVELWLIGVEFLTVNLEGMESGHGLATVSIVPRLALHALDGRPLLHLLECRHLRPVLHDVFHLGLD